MPHSPSRGGRHAGPVSLSKGVTKSSSHPLSDVRS
jgi:hypothetical protein